MNRGDSFINAQRNTLNQINTTLTHRSRINVKIFTLYTAQLLNSQMEKKKKKLPDLLPLVQILKNEVLWPFHKCVDRSDIQMRSERTAGAAREVLPDIHAAATQMWSGVPSGDRNWLKGHVGKGLSEPLQHQSRARRIRDGLNRTRSRRA